jgi:hypothetical protein
MPTPVPSIAAVDQILAEGPVPRLLSERTTTCAVQCPEEVREAAPAWCSAPASEAQRTGAEDSLAI